MRTATHTKMGITLKASEQQLLWTSTHTKLGTTLETSELESITQQLTQTGNNTWNFKTRINNTATHTKLGTTLETSEL